MNNRSKTELTSPKPMYLLPAGQGAVTKQSLNAGEEFPHQTCSHNWSIAQAAFDDLLSWLGPDPEAAGQTYEFIRRKLIILFQCRGCVFPEDLADETINRVARKLPQIKPSYTGNPALYFYGVARKIYKEHLRSLVAPSLPPPSLLKENREDLLQHLDDALSKLEQVDRELILNYYRGDGQSKINHRKAMADQMGLGANALRLRVHRIRGQLRSLLNL